MIASSMGADVDFKDIAVGSAGDFLPGIAATGTALLIIGEGDGFVTGVEMIVVASAMPLAAWLLSTFAFLAAGTGGGWLGLGGGGRFGFSSIETAFQFADFALEALNVFFQIGFALDGALMLGSPKMGLLTQFDKL